MSQTKFKLPDYVRLEVISYIKGYDQRRKKYFDDRDAIINCQSFGFEEYIPLNGDDENVYLEVKVRSGGAGNPTEDKARKLEALENSPELLKLKAVEQAKCCIGTHIINEEIRRGLTEAIWISCLYGGRYYPYEILSLPTIHRDEYYEYRREFLYNIAKNAGLI